MGKRETGLFQRQGSPLYHYDFLIKGNRFHGSTGTANRREAEQIVRAKKEAARQQASASTGTLTFGLASTRYYEDIGQYAAKPREVMAQLAWLQREIGKSTPLTAINNDMVARLVTKRRADTIKPTKPKTKRGEKAKAAEPPRPVSNATVNRSVTQPLRRVLKAAAENWDAQVLRINWKKHMLPEKTERIREASEDEEARIFEHLPEAFHPPILFAIMSGCRLSEVVGLRWDWISWGNRQITVHGKGDKVATVPLSNSLRELLFPLQGNHPEFVFTFTPTEQHGKRKGREGKIPMKWWNLSYYWRKAREAAGIPNSRENQVAGLRFHDMRHTAATRLLRQSRNLKMVQKLLRHSSIATTAKYAHVLDDELAAAMDDISTSKKAATK